MIKKNLTYAGRILLVALLLFFAHEAFASKKKIMQLLDVRPEIWKSQNSALPVVQDKKIIRRGGNVSLLLGLQKKKNPESSNAQWTCTKQIGDISSLKNGYLEIWLYAVNPENLRNGNKSCLDVKIGSSKTHFLRFSAYQGKNNGKEHFIKKGWNHLRFSLTKPFQKNNIDWKNIHFFQIILWKNSPPENADIYIDQISLVSSLRVPSSLVLRTDFLIC